MALIVQKFGGSSVADTDSILRVARRIVDTKLAGNHVVVVVSAMGDTTDELIDMSIRVTSGAPRREMDILLSCGERISMSLLSMAINELGKPHGITAKSYTGQQAGLKTDHKYGAARIVDVDTDRINRSIIDGGNIAIVAGFQGYNVDSHDVTTLGRGGSDTTAVALAAGLGADVCEIYSDVDGVFTADPRVVPRAKKLNYIGYDDMLELSAAGAKILAVRCVEYARRFKVPIHTRSSFTENSGTIICDLAKTDVQNIPGFTLNSNTSKSNPKGGNMKEQFSLEDPIISGVAHDTTESKITITKLDDVPGVAARVFELLAKESVNVDMIVQNVSVNGKSDISFTCPTEQVEGAVEAIEALQGELNFESVLHDEQIGKLSLVGAGMKTHPGVAAAFFEALRDANVNIELISTSEIRISVVTRAEDLPRAVQAVHAKFGLDGDADAVVYAGTGR